MARFIIFNWYWNVGNGPTGQVYSSARATFVPSSDSVYEAWAAAGNTPSTMDTVADLMAYLTMNFPAGTPYGAAIAAGVQITSTGTPAINGTYALDDTSQAKITSEQVYIATAGKFTNGQTSRAWPDISNVPHTFPTIAEFTAFAEAVAQYVDALIAANAVMAAGGAWVAPAQPAALP